MNGLLKHATSYICVWRACACSWCHEGTAVMYLVCYLDAETCLDDRGVPIAAARAALQHLEIDVRSVKERHLTQCST